MTSEDVMAEDKKGYGEGGKVEREKYWVELTVEEKVERMRWAVKQRFDMIEGRLRAMSELLIKLENHGHAPESGEVVVPLRANRLMGAESDRRREPSEQDQRDGKVFF
jgi:hypothetical protein